MHFVVTLILIRKNMWFNSR